MKSILYFKLQKLNNTHHKLEKRTENLHFRNSQFHETLQKKKSEFSSLNILITEKENFLFSLKQTQREKTKSLREEEFEQRKILNQKMNETKNHLLVILSQISESENRISELREVTKQGIQSMFDNYNNYKSKYPEQRNLLQTEILKMKNEFSELRMNLIQQKLSKEKEIHILKEKLSNIEKSKKVSIREQLKLKSIEINTIRQRKSSKENERDQLYFMKEQTMNELSCLNRAVSDRDEEYQILVNEIGRKEKQFFEIKQGLRIRLQAAVRNQMNIEKELQVKMKIFADINQKVKQKKENYMNILKKCEDCLVQCRRKTEELQNSFDESKRTLSKTVSNLVQYQNKIKDATKVFDIVHSQMKQASKEKQGLSENVDDVRREVVHQRTEKVIRPRFVESDSMSDILLELPHDSESLSLSDLQAMRETYNQFMILLEAQRGNVKSLENELQYEELKNADLKVRNAELQKMKDEIARWRKRFH
jgi:chromosome segregation ATPase